MSAQSFSQLSRDKRDREAILRALVGCGSLKRKDGMTSLQAAFKESSAPPALKSAISNGRLKEFLGAHDVEVKYRLNKNGVWWMDLYVVFSGNTPELDSVKDALNSRRE